MPSFFSYTIIEKFLSDTYGIRKFTFSGEIEENTETRN